MGRFAPFPYAAVATDGNWFLRILLEQSDLGDRKDNLKHVRQYLRVRGAKCIAQEGTK
jgi:hypothetical protein